MASTSISSSPSDLELLNTAALLLRLTPEDKERLIEQTAALAQEELSPTPIKRPEDESPVDSSKTTTASGGSNECRERFDDALKAFSDAYIAALLTGDEAVPNLSSMLCVPPQSEQCIVENRAPPPPPRLPGDARLFGKIDFGRVMESQTPTTSNYPSFVHEEQQAWTSKTQGAVGCASFPSSGEDTTGRASVKSAAGMSFQKIQCFKTKQCRFWLDGRCTRGDECTFAHCDGELREKPDLTKTKICAKWRAGQCDKADVLCSYAHGVEELRQVQAEGPDSLQSREDAPQGAWWSPAIAQSGQHW